MTQRYSIRYEYLFDIIFYPTSYCEQQVFIYIYPKERGQKKNGIMWEKFPKGGEGSDPNPLHTFLCFFPIQGLIKWQKR